ncbi:hypothetical protein L1987_45508 [Smallanthus sonchifolius]|uniref:Uncharacterized protein n=1 Tax=Smallanthus sonchifolius TaxID=185202 RepID=A0ACB9FY69_9ASTR|nr:hypothetical protein L1987_45508 [Smallanthus sonchifolius]
MGSQSGLCSNLHIVKIDLRNNALKQDMCFRCQRDRVIDDGCAQSTTRLRSMSLESSPMTQLHNYRYSVGFGFSSMGPTTSSWLLIQQLW